MNTRLLTGKEPLLGLAETTVKDFWAWAYSDIHLNTIRGTFAEFLVARVLGLSDSPQRGWDFVDLRYRDKTIEIKASAYLQSWHQDELSKIIFGIAKRRPWDADTNLFGEEPVRSADIYIFCLFTEKDRTKANILDTGKWEFYPVLTSVLVEKFGDQKTLGLATLKTVAEPVVLTDLKDRIDGLLFGE